MHAPRIEARAADFPNRNGSLRGLDEVAATLPGLRELSTRGEPGGARGGDEPLVPAEAPPGLRDQEAGREEGDAGQDELGRRLVVETPAKDEVRLEEDDVGGD